MVVDAYKDLVCVFDRRTGRALGQLATLEGTDLGQVALSPDGRYAIIVQVAERYPGDDDAMKRVSLNDVAALRQLWVIEASTRRLPVPVAGRDGFFPDGASYLAARGGRLVQVDVQTGRALRIFDDVGEVALARVLRNGTVVVVTKGGTLLEVPLALDAGPRTRARFDATPLIASASDGRALRGRRTRRLRHPAHGRRRRRALTEPTPGRRVPGEPRPGGHASARGERRGGSHGRRRDRAGQ